MKDRAPSRHTARWPVQPARAARAKGGRTDGRRPAGRGSVHRPGRRRLRSAGFALQASCKVGASLAQVRHLTVTCMNFSRRLAALLAALSCAPATSALSLQDAQRAMAAHNPDLRAAALELRGGPGDALTAALRPAAELSI